MINSEFIKEKFLFKEKVQVCQFSISIQFVKLKFTNFKICNFKKSYLMASW